MLGERRDIGTLLGSAMGKEKESCRPEHTEMLDMPAPHRFLVPFLLFVVHC